MDTVIGYFCNEAARVRKAPTGTLSLLVGNFQNMAGPCAQLETKATSQVSYFCLHTLIAWRPNFVELSRMTRSLADTHINWYANAIVPLPLCQQYGIEIC